MQTAADIMKTADGDRDAGYPTNYQDSKELSCNIMGTVMFLVQSCFWYSYVSGIAMFLVYLCFWYIYVPGIVMFLVQLCPWYSSASCMGQINEETNGEGPADTLSNQLLDCIVSKNTN